MSRWNTGLAAIALAGSLAASASEPAPLTTLRAIHRLTNPEASHLLPVAFEATVTYFRPYERTMFVQDDGVAIYVQATTQERLVPGDRILIEGMTQPSFRPFVLSSKIKFLRHGDLPKPIAATFDQLIRAERDCMFVSVRGRVRTADIIFSSGIPSTSLQVMTDDGEVGVVADSNDPAALKSLLDADVEVTGAEAGQFDGKMQQTGVLLHVTSLAGVTVLKRAEGNVWSLPLTPMDEILTAYHARDLTQRVRVRGTITYYQPGSMLVLQNGDKSLWIMTHTRAPLHIGNRADAVGFPTVHDGFLTLVGGEIQETPEYAPIVPKLEDWRLLASSKHIFDLVSIDGVVVTSVREAAQDEYVLLSDGELFSAVYRHPVPVDTTPVVVPEMKQIPVGARVRVTGICMLTRSTPFEGQVPFDIVLRSFDDIHVIARPSLLNVRNLTYVVSILLLSVLVVGVWGWTMKVKVRRQTAALAARIESEAALERRMAKLEQGRSRILEDINGAKPLAEIIEQVTELISFRLYGVPCWCEISGGARLGNYPHDLSALRVMHTDIESRSGQILGVLSAGFDPGSAATADERDSLSAGVKLAALAVETRRLYADLRHRSEFDQLTDIHNRFSLEKYLISLIDEARDKAGIFGLIYIDLDEFKQVNDLYGHRVGDLYLQEVAERMKRQLRSADMLARLGGDEFAAVMPLIDSRARAEEIAQRLQRCFDEPFEVSGYTLQGSASLGIAVYPEDGTTKDSILSAADAAMYVAKYTRRHLEEQIDSPSSSRVASRGRG